MRGAHKAFLEFVELFEQGTTDRPSLRVGIAHADAPERLEALRELVARTRPQAQVEVETTLGAVVGTHAGPGAVGFFWFDDVRGLVVLLAVLVVRLLAPGTTVTTGLRASSPASGPRGG